MKVLSPRSLAGLFREGEMSLKSVSVYCLIEIECFENFGMERKRRRRKKRKNIPSKVVHVLEILYKYDIIEAEKKTTGEGQNWVSLIYARTTMRAHVQNNLTPAGSQLSNAYLVYSFITCFYAKLLIVNKKKIGNFRYRNSDGRY